MKLAATVAAVMLVVACGGRDTPDDQGLHNDIVNGSSGAEVTFDATILTDPVESGGHERFEVRVPTGEMLEVDHNTSLAQVVPAQLYIDPGPRYGVHCTHAATSSGCPNPGWIEYGNNYYE